MIFFIMIAGIGFPIATTVLGFILVISRIFYGFYISRNGPNHPLRVLGAVLGDLGLLGLFGLTVATCLKHVQ